MLTVCVCSSTQSIHIWRPTHETQRSTLCLQERTHCRFSTCQIICSSKFFHIWTFSHSLTRMLMERRVKFRSPQNISGASQQNRRARQTEYVLALLALSSYGEFTSSQINLLSLLETYSGRGACSYFTRYLSVSFCCSGDFTWLSISMVVMKIMTFGWTYPVNYCWFSWEIG